MAKQALILTEKDYGLDTPYWADMLVEANIAVWSYCLGSEEAPDAVYLSVDILLVDLLDVTEHSIAELVEKAVSFGNKYGFTKARVPMIAITDASIPISDAMLAPFADVLKPPLTQDLITNRLTSLMRLATMRREAERRAKTFKRFGVGLPVVPPPNNLDEQRLLYLGSGMAFLPVQIALPETIDTFAALTPSMAVQFLDQESYDALIIEVSDYNEHLIQFIYDLRRNPNYFSFPIILVCHKKATEDGLAGLAAGANDIVSFPFSERFFENRIDILVREERYRQQLKKIFNEARLLMPTDEVTRLYSEEFLKAHLDVLTEQESTASVTFAGIDITFDTVRGDNDMPKPGPSLIAKVGRMISALMRAEDMLARLDSGHFVAFFPDTDLFEARIALQRIRSIVHLSPFVDQNSGRGVNVTLDFSMCHVDTSETNMDVDATLKNLFENPVVRF